MDFMMVIVTVEVRVVGGDGDGFVGDSDDGSDGGGGG